MENGEWRNGLFSQVCGGDCGTCMGAWFCSCFLYGRVAGRLDQFPNEETPDMCNGPCWLMCGAAYCHLHWLVALFKRGDVRNKYGIKGDGCTDCLASYFCYPCTLAQMETEIKDRAKTAQMNGGEKGYSQPQQMSYQQQSEKAYQPQAQQGYPQQPEVVHQQTGYTQAYNGKPQHY